MKTIPPLLLAAALLAPAISVFGADPATSTTNLPITINASADWIALRPELEIQPGSALDFSGLRSTDEPAGKHGRVIARADGQFAFADSPRQPRRFYGVNFCFSALYLSRDQADRIAERLARLGYNALRIHHYERELTQNQPRSTILNPEKLDQLDYFGRADSPRHLSDHRPLRFAGYSLSRHWHGARRRDSDGHLQDTCARPRGRVRELETIHARVPWPQQSLYAPALQRGAGLGVDCPDQRRQFREFLQRNSGVPGMAPGLEPLAGPTLFEPATPGRRLGAEHKDQEDPAADNVALPEQLQGKGLRSRDCIAFLADTDREMVRRMRAFLRDELGCRALVSNSSSWTRFTTDQGSRETYDYVDDHFYVDHPKFLEAPWRLPSRCPNASPITEGAPGGRTITFTRLYDKPFTVTEFNYSGPAGSGVSAASSPARWARSKAAGGIWRFAYGHNQDSLFNPAPMDYFNLVSDPLSQAADRASLCLFLRGDLQTAPRSVALAMTAADLAHPPAGFPRWQRIGTGWPGSPASAPWCCVPPGKRLPATPWFLWAGRRLAQTTRPKKWCPSRLIAWLTPSWCRRCGQCIVWLQTPILILPEVSPQRDGRDYD